MYKSILKSLKKSEKPNKSGVKLNPEHGKMIADAYENMQHDPSHPDVQAAYGALIEETKAQYNDILKSGIKLSRMKDGQENPYKNSKELHHDIKNNNHMHFYPTDQGFGMDDSASDHPMLQGTGIMHDGHELLANDLFRIVHDINGHHLGGESGFGAKGEHKAYNQHKTMYSPLAQKALATETLGQNSWVNFGPHGEHNKANPQQTRYADQKAGLLPDEITSGNWHSDEGDIQKAEKGAKAIKEVAHEQDMMSESGRPMPNDHIADDHDPSQGKEDKKVKQALSDLKENKQTTKNMFQRVYSMPSEDKIRSKRAKMTGQVPESISVYGSHYPVVKLLNDNTLLLHTSEYGNEGKTQELVNKIKKELPEQFPDHRVIEVHHPDYKHSSRVMRMRNKTGIHKFLEEASEGHPDEDYKQHAKEALAHLLSLKKGEFSKPIHAKRTATEGFDAEANMQTRTDRIGKYLESVGLTPDIGSGNKRDLGSKSPTSVTINAKGDPHDQQLLHEGGHAMLTPEGASLSEYQTGIGEPGYKGKLHQTQYRDELKESHGGGMPEQTAQQMEAGIARRSGVEPFRSPQRGVSPKSETEKGRAHAKEQLKMFDAGIYRFDPFSGENELQGDIHAYINAKEMGKKDLAEKIRQKLLTKIKAKNKMKESGEWEDDIPLAASEKFSSDITKGSRQSKMPFNPKTDISDSDRTDVEDWTGGYGANDREKIKPIKGNARKRALDRLHRLTDVKKHPKTGERMFLMHRGMDKEEYLKHYDTVSPFPTDSSSWTPHHKVANNFAKDYSVGHSDGKREPSVVSAWIPESKIRHIPNAIGGKSRDVDDIGWHPHDNPKKAHRHDEHEVIVDAHKMRRHYGYSPEEQKKKQMHSNIDGGLSPEGRLEERRQMKSMKDKKLAASEKDTVKKL